MPAYCGALIVLMAECDEVTVQFNEQNSRIRYRSRKFIGLMLLGPAGLNYGSASNPDGKLAWNDIGINETWRSRGG